MPAEPTEDQRVLVAKYVRSARLAMGRSIDEAAAAVNMSPVTWSRVEKGQAARSLTYAGIERSLGWRAGSIEALIERGLEPEPESSDRGQPPNEARPVAEVEALIADIWSDGRIPEERKAALVRMIRQAEAERQAVEDELRRWRSA